MENLIPNHDYQEIRPDEDMSYMRDGLPIQAIMDIIDRSYNDHIWPHIDINGPKEEFNQQILNQLNKLK